ncbi:MAG TPA: hypothetical protein VKU86_01325 [Acidimicrobiales bacterium]|nr:hypothetical protein [Acidimicrobiales bacterium]
MTALGLDGASGTQTLADAALQSDDSEWHGPVIRYDLAKEFVIALVAMVVLAVALAIVFSSPDEAPATITAWASSSPSDFLTTAVAELDGSSPTAGYGPPYNAWAPGEGQKIGPLGVERWVGVHTPVDTAHDFVLAPLGIIAKSDPALAAGLTRYESASAADQQQWTTAYTKALDKVSFSGSSVVVPPGRYGPVPTMMSALLQMARGGSLDGALLSSPRFYGTDYTKPLLFLADGSYLADKANAQHLAGNQWGMMNETGNYPGQAWLWLYTMWYQIPPFTHTGNADALIWSLMMLLSLALLLLPFIPGLRSIPKLVPVYRLIWRDHYRRLATESPGGGPRAG